MDKDTAVELEKLKAEVNTLKEAKKQWDSLIRDTIIHTVKWLIMVGVSAALFGWHLPSEVRKTITQWLSE